FALHGTETGEREGQGVRAWRQLGDAVLAAAVGDRGPDFFDQGGARGFDRHAGEYGFRGVAHDAGEGRLRERDRGTEGEGADEDGCGRQSSHKRRLLRKRMGDRPPRRTVRCEARVYAYENFRSIRKREEMHAARTVQYGSTRVWITGRNEASRVVTGRVRVVTGHRTSRHESPDESRRIAGTSAHSLRPVLLRRDSLRPGAESHRPSSTRDHFFRSTSA